MLNAEYSITHLESIAGVLRVPAKQRRAHIYYRDPAYLDTLSPDERSQCETTDPKQKQLLNQLLSELREAVGARFRTYATPEALRQMVQDDVLQLAGLDFPVQTFTDPFETERANHLAFAVSRMENFVPLPRLVALARQLTDVAVSSDAPLQAIHGPSGTGKSSLMAFMVSEMQQAASSSRDVLMAVHFVGHTAHSAQHMNMLHVRFDEHEPTQCSKPRIQLIFVLFFVSVFQRLLWEIRQWSRGAISDSLPVDTMALTAALTEWLYVVAGIHADKTIYIFLDALNQLQNDDNAHQLKWLPEV